MQFLSKNKKKILSNGKIYTFFVNFYLFFLYKHCKITVAPRAGAWIETYADEQEQHLSVVVPRAGAWIETA